MSYTDIWRCKKCDVLPDIQMIGRSFRIACETCEHQKAVEADSLSEVVARWNKLHAPTAKRTGLAGLFQQWTDTAKGFVEYQRDRFRQGREREARLRQSVLEIQDAEEREDNLEAPIELLPEPER